MKLAGIFQDLEHLYDFQQLPMAAILFFKVRQNFAQVFIAINIPCKFGEDVFINE